MIYRRFRIFLDGEYRYFDLNEAKYFLMGIDLMLSEIDTGLTDRNNKPIYEGDIVRYGFGDEDIALIGYHKINYGDDIRLCTLDIKTRKPINDFYGGVFNTEDMVVVGNINETPELLNDSPATKP